MPSRLVEVTDPETIERFARRDPALHLYEIGDLDPFFWPHTRWWGLSDAGGDLCALALLYAGGEPRTLLALARPDDAAAAELLVQLRPQLPDRLYAHLGPGLAARLAPRYAIEPHGRHLKMALTGGAGLDRVDTTGVERLSQEDLADLRALYQRAYPENWFDPRMLTTRQYFGVRERGELVCAAGVHVYSPRYAVAALGNVTTDPACRGRGLATRTTARLCQSLCDAGISTLGLNVLSQNAAAIRCYERLGFAIVGEYDEVMLSA